MSILSAAPPLTLAATDIGRHFCAERLNAGHEPQRLSQLEPSWL